MENKIEGLDSMLFMSHAGKRGGHALAQVLSGEITPSGKLADTWTVNYEDYPSSATFARHDKNSVEEDYSDDIYVGYRYFDTFGVDVAYPFGYGLSYADFAFSDITVEADTETVTASVTVTNTGDTAGKEVVEIYYSAPDVSEEDILSCDLENPYQELAAFAKTDELQPGESQTLTIAYNTDEMASYSEKNAAYVLQKGDYIIRVGNSSRNTSVAAVISMDDSAVTKQLTNRMVIDEEIDVLQREDSENVIANFQIRIMIKKGVVYKEMCTQLLLYRKINIYSASKSINSVIRSTSNASAIFDKCSKLMTVRVPLTISLIVDSRIPESSASFFCVMPRFSIASFIFSLTIYFLFIFIHSLMKQNGHIS